MVLQLILSFEIVFPYVDWWCYETLFKTCLGYLNENHMNKVSARGVFRHFIYLRMNKSYIYLCRMTFMAMLAMRCGTAGKKGIL